MISIIVAYDKNNAIGKDNKLLWKIPEDLKFFKNTTNGFPVIMGRKTFESIGKPLPNRKNIILTRNNQLIFDNCIVYNSIKQIISDYTNQDVFVIGGSEIYNLVFPYVDKLYVTYVDHEFEADTFFPKIDQYLWNRVSSEKGIRNDKNPYDYYFQTFVRR